MTAVTVRNYMLNDQAFLTECENLIDSKLPDDGTNLPYLMRATWHGYFQELLEVDRKIIEKLNQYIDDTEDPKDSTPYNKVRRGLVRENFALATAESIVGYLLVDPDLQNALTKRMLEALQSTFELEKRSNREILNHLPQI